MPRVPAATAEKAVRERLSPSTASPRPPMPAMAAAWLAARGSISVEIVASSGVPGRASRGRSRSHLR